MRYSGAKMTGSAAEAGSGAAIVQSRPMPGGAVSDIVLAVTERQISPGATACFPFAARTAYGTPSIHEFNVISDNPNFNPEWVRLGRSAGDSYGPRYTLEISPGDIERSQYGAYPLRLSWRAAGTYRQAGGQCMLIIKPRVRTVAEPVVKIRPAGEIWLLMENRESTGIDVSVSLRQCGSDWSKEWEFALAAKDGPSSFSRSFDSPASRRRGDYELVISAAGVPLVRQAVRGGRSLVSRRHTSGTQVSA